MPFLAVYFAWKREIKAVTWAWLVAAFAAAAVFANIYPFPISPDSQTQVLAVLHLPIALWLVIGVAYVGGGWFAGDRRMDFVRFSGELFIYFVLIALGGGVLTRVFAPLFTALLVLFLVTMAWTGSPIDIEREVLIAFDLLLAVVVGLVLYAASAGSLSTASPRIAWPRSAKT